MSRIALTAVFAVFLASTAFAQQTTPDKPGAPKAPPAAKNEKPAAKPETNTAKPDTKTGAKPTRVTYACDGGVSMVVTYPPEGQAKTRPVKIAMKDTTYFVRPAAEGAKFENPKIKLVFQAKGDEAVLEREGKPLAEKCKSAKPGT
ncbi:MAG: MliC family protein [Alphaproteobacteria bacterium]